MKSVTAKVKQKRSSTWITLPETWDVLCAKGYHSLSQSPEVVAGVRVIAELISSMTIYLMQNTEHGDKRIINELSRAVDIRPNGDYMTRRTWMDSIVMTLLLYGRGNAIVWPHTSSGYLQRLEPIDAARVSFKPDDGGGYKILIDNVAHEPSDLLHFVHNPDEHYPWKGQGITVALRDVADNLAQAAATEKGFMQSKWKPSVIIKVDALTEEFASPTGRKKLLDDYISTSEAGEPWMIPAEQFSVEQVKPLTLADLAIADVVQLDKRTVASIIGVPPFVLGVGEYNAAAWNAFIQSKIMPIALEIQQELSAKLLLSPKWYWRFNISSLYSYDMKTIESVYSDMYVKGLAKGNEVRDKMGMEPLDGLDELVILENYIPLGKIGDQLKLNQED